jgi:hypothetical protein
MRLERVYFEMRILIYMRKKLGIDKNFGHESIGNL